MKKIKVTISPMAIVNGQTKGFYPSMAACARELGLQQSHVSEVCSGKRKSHKGFVFQKIKEENNG